MTGGVLGSLAEYAAVEGRLVDPQRYTMDTVEAAYAPMENKTARGKIIVDTGA